MFLAMFFLLASLFSKELIFQQSLDGLSDQLHEICLNYAPKSPFSKLYQSLVCGKKLSSSFKKLYLESGITHLMIVSGFHLIFLEKFIYSLSFLFKKNQKKLTTFFFLFLMTLICQLNPPILKAFSFWVFSQINLKWKLYWSSFTKHLISVSFCLFLFPDWWLKTSLILSGIACFSFCLKTSNQFKSYFILYFLLSPVLLNFQTLNLYNIFKVWLVTPFFSFVLFPLTLVSYIFHFLSPLNDALWSLFNKFLMFINKYQIELEVSNQGHLTSLSYLWIYLFGLYFLAYFINLWRRRKYLSS